MVRERVKTKKARLSPEQCFSLERDSINTNQEFMELYEGDETKGYASENLASLETMIGDEAISQATAQIEEYSEKYDTEEEMVQCVPELPVVSTPVEDKTKVSEVKHGPRVKVTPTRKDIAQKIQRKKVKGSKKTTSVTPHVAGGESSDQEDFPKAKKEGTWIQCSKIDCMKWRKLPNDVEPSTMPDRWVCAMNLDSSRTECGASQETCDSQEDFDVVYTPFVAGSLVWAKVPGYPWWPGMIEDDPDYKCCYETDDSNVNPISYHVSFIFDKEVSRSWVSCLGIRNFSDTENPNKTGPKYKKYVKPLSKALTQTRKAMSLPLAERINKYSFNVLYKGQIGYKTDVKPSKESKKKGKQDKTTKKGCKQMKKRPSLTDSENGGENTQNSLKKRVKKRKRVLTSSDEDESGRKEIDADAPKDSGSIAAVLEKSEDLTAGTDETMQTPEVQAELGSQDDSKDEISSQVMNNTENESIVKDEGTKTSGIKKKKAVLSKNGALKKKKRKRITSDEEEKSSPKMVKSPTKTASSVKSKPKKKKLQKAEDCTRGKDGKISKKKSKFANPVEVKPVSNVSNENSPNSKDEGNSFTEEQDATLLQSEDLSALEELMTATSDDLYVPSSTKKHVKPGKKKSTSTEESKDSTESKVSVVKQKKFDVSLAFGKKSKPAVCKEKTKKIKKTRTSLVSKKDNDIRNQKENAREAPLDITLEGSSVMPGNSSGEQKPAKTTSKSKKAKQTFGKFKAPVKAKVTPAKVLPRAENDDEESSKKRLEEVLGISVSDDPRKNPGNYVSIDSLENDISSLYRELSENLAESTGVMESDDVTEASDCVTMEFLDHQISGNTTQQYISERRLTDPPEF